MEKEKISLFTSRSVVGGWGHRNQAGYGNTRDGVTFVLSGVNPNLTAIRRARGPIFIEAHLNICPLQRERGGGGGSGRPGGKPEVYLKSRSPSGHAQTVFQSPSRHHHAPQSLAVRSDSPANRDQRSETHRIAQRARDDYVPTPMEVPPDPLNSYPRITSRLIPLLLSALELTDLNGIRYMRTRKG